jgi:hypothetical protein
MIDCCAWHFRQDRNVLDRDQAMHAGRLGVVEPGRLINVTIAVL